MSNTFITSFLGIESVREVAQAILTGLSTGGAYALIGVAMALILGVTGRFHFAFGIVYASTAYLTAVVVGSTGLPLVPAAIIGLLAGVVVGVLCEALVYRPLAERAGDNALLGIFVASLGLVIAGENAMRLIWGNDARSIPSFSQRTFDIAEVSFTALELTQVVVAVMVVIALTATLNRTILGQQIRAVRANPEMAEAVGIDVARIFLVVMAVAAFIGGLAALIAGMRFAATPDMGNTVVFYAFVVAFVAGVQRSPVVVAAVGFGIGIVESLSTLWVSDNLSAVVVFGLLIAWLTVRVLPTALSQLRGAMSPSHPRRAPRPPSRAA